MYIYIHNTSYMIHNIYIYIYIYPSACYILPRLRARVPPLRRAGRGSPANNNDNNNNDSNDNDNTSNSNNDKNSNSTHNIYGSRISMSALKENHRLPDGVRTSICFRSVASPYMLP